MFSVQWRRGWFWGAHCVALGKQQKWQGCHCFWDGERWACDLKAELKELKMRCGVGQEWSRGWWRQRKVGSWKRKWDSAFHVLSWNEVIGFRWWDDVRVAICHAYWYFRWTELHFKYFKKIISSIFILNFAHSWGNRDFPLESGHLSPWKSFNSVSGRWSLRGLYA